MNRLEGRRIAITGANGNIGLNLCNAFHQSGYEVWALTRDSGRLPGYCHHFKYQLGDLLPIDFPEVEAIVHCAWSMEAKDFALNLDAVASLKSHLVQRNTPMVFISSLSANREGNSAYARAKYAAESLLDSGFDLIIRPGLVVSKGGLFEKLSLAVEALPIIPLPNAKSQIKLIASEDISRTILQALEHGIRGTFNLALEQGMDLSNLVRAISQAKGLRRPILKLPTRLYLASLILAERIGVSRGLRAENLRGLLRIPMRETKETLDLFHVSQRDPFKLINQKELDEIV